LTAIAKDIVAVDDGVASVDPDPELDERLGLAMPQ
jgi:hypothetical protein